MNRTPEERDRWDSPGRKLLGPRPAEPERRKESRQKRSWRVKHKEFAEKSPKERNQEEMGALGWGGSTQKPAPRHSRHTRSPSSSLEMRDLGQAPAPPLSGAALGQRPSQTPGPQTLTELPAMAGTRDRQCWWWVWLLGPQVEAGRDRPAKDSAPPISRPRLCQAQALALGPGRPGTPFPRPLSHLHSPRVPK